MAAHTAETMKHPSYTQDFVPSVDSWFFKRIRGVRSLQVRTKWFAEDNKKFVEGHTTSLFSTGRPQPSGQVNQAYCEAVWL